MTHSQGGSDRPRIFVSIASFCDPLLSFTIEQALQSARHPERLSFGIVDQSEQPASVSLPKGAGRLAYLHVAAHSSRGACWARALAMTLYAGEEFFYQIDSHSCFDPDWDETLIDALEGISASSGNRRVILSTRPFGFDLDDAGQPRRSRFTNGTLRLVPKADKLDLSAPVMSFACYNSRETADLPAFQISAANLFSRGALVDEVPYDPFMYFHGEEQNISLRAYTRGWDLWHPNAVPIYHLYKRRAEGEAPLHWDAVFEDRRPEKWTTLRSRSHERLKRLLTGELEGPYGLGKVRSLQDYLALSGLTLSDAQISTRGPVAAD